MTIIVAVTDPETTVIGCDGLTTVNGNICTRESIKIKTSPDSQWGLGAAGDADLCDLIERFADEHVWPEAAGDKGAYELLDNIRVLFAKLTAEGVMVIPGPDPDTPNSPLREWGYSPIIAWAGGDGPGKVWRATSSLLGLTGSHDCGIVAAGWGDEIAMGAMWESRRAGNGAAAVAQTGIGAACALNINCGGGKTLMSLGSGSYSTTCGEDLRIW